MTKAKGETGESSAPTTPSHQPQSLTRIKSAASVLPGTSSEGSSHSARALTHETRLTFQNFVQLFQAFRYQIILFPSTQFDRFLKTSSYKINFVLDSLRSRKDLRDLFDSIATAQKTEGCTESSQPESPERSHSSSTSGNLKKVQKVSK